MQIDYNFSDNLSILCPALSFGSGGGCAYAAAAARAGANSAKKVKDTIYNTSITSVQANLKEKGVAFYKGVPVCMTDLTPFDGSAFAFGIIVLDDYYEDVSFDKFAETLDHEYGHTKHMQQIGLPAYTITVAVPSLIFAGISTAKIPGVSEFIFNNYYNFPWERIADYLGGVNRGYATGANTVGTLYWLFTIRVGVCMP